MSDLDDLSQVFKNSFSDSVNLRWGMQIDERLPVDEVKLSCLFTGTEADEVIEYIDTSKITSQ
jgi:cell division GTPase FtsZ